MTQPTQNQKLILPLQGMTCQNCAAHVEKALRTLPGVTQVIVDLKTNQASLEYDASIIELVDFQNAVKAAGYTVPTQAVTLRFFLE